MTNGTTTLTPTLSPTGPATQRPTEFKLTRSTDDIRYYVFYLLPFFTFCVLLYSIVRKRAAKVYAPRSKIVPPWQAVKPIGSGFFAWADFKRFLFAGEEYYIQIAHKVGADATVFLRILRLIALLLSCICPLNLAVLLPLYNAMHTDASGGDVEKLDALDRLSLAKIHLDQETGRIGIIICIVYITSFLGMYLIFKEWKVYHRIRWDFLTKPSSDSYTVLVENIPPRLREPRTLKRFFERLARPGGRAAGQSDVLHVELIDDAVDASELEAAIALRDRVVLALERAMMKRRLGTSRNHDCENQSKPSWSAISFGNIGTANTAFKSHSSKAKNDINASRLRQFHRIMCCCCFDRPLHGSVEENEKRLLILNEHVAMLQQRYRNERADVYARLRLERRKRAQTIAARRGVSHVHHDEEHPLLDEDPVFVANIDDDLDGPRATSPSSASLAMKEMMAPLEALKQSVPRVRGFSRASRPSKAEKYVEKESADGAVHFRGRRSAAFVTFRTLQAKASVAGLHISGRPNKLLTRSAPPFDDIIWHNLGRHRRTKICRKWFAYLVGVFLLVPAFGLFTAFIASMTNSEFLREKIPALDHILDKFGDYGAKLLAQVTPMIVILFILLIPVILQWLLSFEGPDSRTRLDLRFAKLYYLFLATNVFLFYSIAGSISDSLQSILAQPSNALIFLAESLPRNSNFYCGYILIKLFGVMPLQLLRVPDLTISGLRRICCSTSITLRERRQKRCGCATIDHPPQVWYGKTISDLLLTFLVVLTYSTISPIILLVGCGYYCFTLMVYHNQILFVYRSEYESGGRMFPFAFNAICSAFVIYHLTMAGLMLGAKRYSFSMLPLLLLDAFFIHCK